MLQVLEAIITGASLLLAFLIFTNPKGVNKKANFWLGFFILSVGAQSLDALLVTHRVYDQYPVIIGLLDGFLFLIPPTFYLATLWYVHPQRKSKRLDFLHFSFFIFFLFFRFPSIILEAPASKLANLHATQAVSLSYQISLGIFLAYFLTYCSLSFLLIQRHQRNIAQIDASSGKNDLQWLKNFIIWVCLLVLMWIVGLFIQWSWVSYLITVTFLIALFLLAHYALHQGEVYNFNPLEKRQIQELLENNTDENQAKIQLLSPDRLQDHMAKLKQLMETEKPHLDNELNLLKLSEKMQSSIHVVSYVINVGFGENFAQFVNRYRVEEAKKLLKTPDTEHLSMLGIAYDAGFNSKTAFNTSFKKLTGLSPSDYKNQGPE